MAPKQDPKPKFQEGLWAKNELAIAGKGAGLLLLTPPLFHENSLLLGGRVPLTAQQSIIGRNHF
ncbi:unnamed protein product [Tetraodon nigroviridis]|uniref:(spotted green pufferfish) hypothetical protein n=1 Tax=Tetraodon nigroviridis TaxID=99883 RepID=Q4SHK6_TETNG|nr:unnamed protein product [Tetraodon nigroviridis]